MWNNRPVPVVMVPSVSAFKSRLYAYSTGRKTLINLAIHVAKQE